MLLPVLVAVGICLIPVWLVRRSLPSEERANCVGVHVRSEAVRNASIAYGMRIAVLAPMFAWGMSGDWWPAVVVTIGLALGVWLIYALRAPLVAFIDAALRENRSITIAGFIAYRHGSDARVRRTTASLTVIALLGSLVAEALALTAFLESTLPGGGAIVWLLVLGVLALAALQSIPAGHSGVVEAMQWQLGMLYVGLAGSMALFLYLHVSARTPPLPHGTLAIVLTAVWCGLHLYLHRSRYVDTTSSSRLLARFGKTLNGLLSIVFAAILVVALMHLYAAEAASTVRDTARALVTPARIPPVALMAIGLLALFHPLVDVVNWQQLATIVRITEPEERAFVLRRVFGGYAARGALLLLFVWLLGAVAANATGTDSPDALLRDDGDATMAIPLLLIAVVAAAMSTMSALSSAMLCTIRCDLAVDAPPARGVVMLGAGVLFASLAGMAFTGLSFVAWLVVACCLQLALGALVIGDRFVKRPGR
ncbi:MAG TPA: hypothetical protein VNE58_02380 [Casimicrobiaceae bacterium]|nr:hypothetical protein [Casimicrobiaceae bacterium]